MIAHELRKMREQAGFTQIEVASKLNYTTSQFVSNWECNVSIPPIGALKKLCKIYDVQPRHMARLVLEVERLKINKVFGLS